MTESEAQVKGRSRQAFVVGQRRIHVGAWVNVQIVGELEAMAAERDISVSRLIAEMVTLDSIVKAVEHAPRQPPHQVGSGRPRAARQPRRYDHDRAPVSGRLTPQMHTLVVAAAKETGTSASGILSQILADATGIEL